LFLNVFIVSPSLWLFEIALIGFEIHKFRT
jgi:hypothetical protein